MRRLSSIWNTSAPSGSCADVISSCVNWFLDLQIRRSAALWRAAFVRRSELIRQASAPSPAMTGKGSVSEQSKTRGWRDG